MLKKIYELSHLKMILNEFPKSIKFCFAYGSGAFRQLNNHDDKMLDLIFVVKNPNKWHAENLKLNPKHYFLPMRYLGHKFITTIQENWGAKIYYNTLVKTKAGQTIKYGIMSDISLIEDLIDWNNLYVAGRLHKPVEVLIEPAENSPIRMALVENLHSAVRAAFLLLPEHFTKINFYKVIAGLSYSGDFRMIFGENKDKIHNIVVPQLQSFQELYAPILQHYEQFIDFPKSEQPTVMCHQDTNPITRIYHLNQLPLTPQIKLVKAWSVGSRSKDMEDCLHSIAYDPECSEILKRSLKEIVWRSSVTQSLKGIFTAGFIKSVMYSNAKIKKMLQSNLQTNIPSESKSDKISNLVETVVKKQTEAKDTDKRLE
ncbi:PREDICTED: phosphatidate cytidylyltransferase, mitochondrial [Polistes canadensis]|uniref:phosphatidate cytidylyltransferase, mitochondrial n=1 Tax=Polistes canadensis TaxID=91411 RepID=UPI000718FAD4|nr:PREDICTED: phosphatidate cytidylyltransferase, mitochondrial [Polistes canadensis]